jgi:uncharacterized membrane protein
MDWQGYLTLGRALTTHDLYAVAFFLAAWTGYAYFAGWYGRRVPSLQGVLDELRKTWALRMVERDNRMVDVNVVRNLTRSSQFFASTTLLVLGALIALMGYVQRAADVVSELPFAVQASQRLWEIKILLLVGIFVYAFFKFTWSAWQYNVLSIIVGASPKATEAEPAEVTQYVENAAHIAGLAGDSYNNGIRAYYFAIALLAWFVDPLMFLAVTLVVTLVLYRREFFSPMLDSLRRVAPGGA